MINQAPDSSVGETALYYGLRLWNVAFLSNAKLLDFPKYFIYIF